MPSMAGIEGAVDAGVHDAHRHPRRPCGGQGHGHRAARAPALPLRNCRTSVGNGSAKEVCALGLLRAQRYLQTGALLGDIFADRQVDIRVTPATARRAALTSRVMVSFIGQPATVSSTVRQTAHPRSRPRPCPEQVGDRTLDLGVDDQVRAASTASLVGSGGPEQGSAHGVASLGGASWRRAPGSLVRRRNQIQRICSFAKEFGLLLVLVQKKSLASSHGDPVATVIGDMVGSRGPRRPTRPPRPAGG